MRSRRDRPGISLIELLIALSISGFAILGGIMLLDQLMDSDARIVTDRAADARAGNGDRLFRRLFADAVATTDTTHRFRADDHNATYFTFCDTPSGWPEACRVSFMLDSVADSTAIVAETSRGEHYVVRRVDGAASFRYFDVSALDSSWVRQWTTSIALPGAIAIVSRGDTIVLPLGSSRD